MKKAFTLLEMLLVIVIISVAALIIVPVVTNNINSSKNNVYNNLINKILVSSTDWAVNTGLNFFKPNVWVEVGEQGIDDKLKALSMYRGVMRPYPHPRSNEAIKGLAAYRGGQVGFVYAEAFECVFRRY